MNLRDSQRKPRRRPVAAPFLAAAVPTANLAVLDRKELGAIVLGAAGPWAEPPHCADAAVSKHAAESSAGRAKQLHHVLAAAHELLVRSATGWLIGRSTLNQPSVVREYLKVHFAGAEVESFVAVYLDIGLRVIAVEELFRGTLTQTSVYPREVVRRTLHHNAACLIVAHCHPSGSIDSSEADRSLTRVLANALKLVDVALIDHVIVAGNRALSMAEAGLMS